ncbi:hypothetical protein Bca52824_035117 [Brassica carinata]|uniref:CCHC-type domain-containing protein n=1 Tax=Brassica carinata TaxID=52824 RepID=A0A8X7S4K6_BRACI|nr:hypothetical protein Bca52824_035117 [Brassica carinata]
MAQFDPSTVGEAHRRATSFEQQSRSSTWTQSNSRRSQDQAASGTPATTTKETGETSSSATKPAAQDEQQLRRSSIPSALRCYSCGEQGHIISACPHATRRGLLTDETISEQDVYDSQEEDGQDDDVHQTIGDKGHLLVLRRTCFTPQRHDDNQLPKKQTSLICSNEAFKSELITEGRVFALIPSASAQRQTGLLHDDIVAPSQSLISSCLMDRLFTTIYILYPPSIRKNEPCG